MSSNIFKAAHPQCLVQWGRTCSQPRLLADNIFEHAQEVLSHDQIEILLLIASLDESFVEGRQLGAALKTLDDNGRSVPVRTKADMLRAHQRDHMVDVIAEFTERNLGHIFHAAR